MQFRDLKAQYVALKEDIDLAISQVMEECSFISGRQVRELERELAEYVGVKHCITCANGTDALALALMAWEIGPGDAVFVPDFTFFSSGEVVPFLGAQPIFVDVDATTFNISCDSLEKMIVKTLEEGKLRPRVIVAVDLFGQPAEYDQLRRIAEKYDLKILEDAAQGFGGRIGEQKACSFGDIATTSFFPAKPLGCYGDGGAIFTDDDSTAEYLRSLCIHGKGKSKYDNIHIGMNSRLDTLQAAILQPKLQAFRDYELDNVNKVASWYTEKLKKLVRVPVIKEGFYSSWAQYTIVLENKEQRDGLQEFLRELEIPSMVYYFKPMHKQKAFGKFNYDDNSLKNTIGLCDTVLSLPLHPYMDVEDVEYIANAISKFMKN
ncbi:MAG: DegT/DnrJ/EryC1/StrS aminotransferase family protein [Lachnospiraceae bacterium]|nr:DegT/DnrJ/EryC1/StrS aminotransferase family protein [Lachnospiraceae bacterium]